tara:strand:- start:726 stop:1256 length:531 start_codon:yes stop_codon:yes gene_type:complete
MRFCKLIRLCRILTLSGVYFILVGCSSASRQDIISLSSYSETYSTLINKYSTNYFVGFGIGFGDTEEIALKIAKARALGELADNVKVTIMSKLEVISTEITVGNQSQFSESVKEKIISIGNATIRSPEYEILNLSRRDAKFHAEVLAKKLMNKHVEESARDLEFVDDIDKILELLK